MLTLSPSAVEAVDALLASPEVPDGAGLRIAAAEAPDGSGAQLQVSLVTEPAADDQVIEDGNARVFVDDAISDVVDDATLQAAQENDRLTFALSRDGGSEANGGAGAA